MAAVARGYDVVGYAEVCYHDYRYPSDASGVCADGAYPRLVRAMGARSGERVMATRANAAAVAAVGRLGAGKLWKSSSSDSMT